MTPAGSRYNSCRKIIYSTQPHWLTGMQPVEKLVMKELIIYLGVYSSGRSKIKYPNHWPAHMMLRFSVELEHNTHIAQALFRTAEYYS